MMLRVTLVTAMLLGASFMAAPAPAADNPPRLVPAQYVWQPWPAPGHWEWGGDRRGDRGGWEGRGDRHCRWLRRRLADLRDSPPWDRDWGEIRELRWRLRSDCPDY